MRAKVEWGIWKLVSSIGTEKPRGEGARMAGSCAGAFERGESGGQVVGREEALYAHGPPSERVWEWAFAPDP